MWSLFFDQSFSEGAFGLFNEAQVVEEQYRELKQARHPPLEWQKLLDRQRLQLQDVGFFVCGVGPGSYTGLRSAAAVVKAAALATKKPIVAVSSLLLHVPSEKGLYRVIVNAGMGCVYAQTIEITAQVCHVGVPERMELEAFLASVQPGMTIVTNAPGWRATEVVVPRHLATVAKVAYQEWAAGRLYTARTLPLVYLRKTQAEIEAEQKDR